MSNVAQPNGIGQQPSAAAPAVDPTTQCVHTLTTSTDTVSPKPVDLASVLDRILALLGLYIVAAPPDLAGITLWIAFTHGFDAFRIAPRLAIQSPEKRCGKTTLISLLTHLVRNPLACSNATPAAIFRTIQETSPTLLLDEADTYLTKDSADLRGILNSGHIRSTAFVLRCQGKEFVPKRFSTWAPMAQLGRSESCRERYRTAR